MPVWLRDGVVPLVLIAALFAAGLCLLVYLAQARLIFYPQPITDDAARALQRSFARSVAFELETQDGVRLRGWWVRSQTGIGYFRRARRAFPFSAASVSGKRAIRSSSVLRAVVLSPMAAWALPRLSSASGTLGLSG